VELFVVGAGYVGLTTAVGFSQLGHRVTVHDIDEERIASLAGGRPTIMEAGMDAALREGLDAGTLTFTTHATPPPGARAGIVCVPTPTDGHGLLDLAVVEMVVLRLARELAPGAPIVIRSTLPLHGPDRLDDLAIEVPGRPLVINPEFMREGRALADFAAPSRVAVGYLRDADRDAARFVAELYEPLGAPLVLADARSVVLLKLASNVFLGLKIAFANELARLSDAIGADVTAVTDGMGLDPRIGRAFLESGPGFGGSCLPEQAAAIAVETASRSVRAPLMGAIWISNRTHQGQLVESLGAMLPGGLPGARVAVLGLAFKAHTNDVRHSPALALAAELRAAGATVVGHDPVANDAARRADPQLQTADNPVAAATGADAVLVATEWPAFAALDWDAIRRAMRGDVVYDSRRVLRPDAVVAAGLRYRALGKPRHG
jgi:UDPglucose 6-dehydrogenase